MHLERPLGVTSGQELAQELGEEVVVAVQRLLVVEGDDEQVLALEVGEHPRAVAPAGQGIAEGRRELVEH